MARGSLKVSETLRGVTRELEERGAECPGAEAEILLASVLGLLDEPRRSLFADPSRELNGAQARTLASLLLRRGRGVPVQYLVRRAWFRELSLEVGPGVLIPRPETEVLAGEVISWLARRPRGGAAPRVLDLGTGSGCIALSVALERPGARVTASDASMEALAYAKRNRERAGRDVGASVDLLATDGFSAFRPGPSFDVVVSNPPYVGENERDTLSPEVVDHEPAAALFGGPDGTAMLDRIVHEAPRWLRPGGLLAVEVGDTQADNVIDRISSRGAYRPACAVKDLGGTPRVVLAERLE